jgi:hypothetical protein
VRANFANCPNALETDHRHQNDLDFPPFDPQLRMLNITEMHYSSALETRNAFSVLDPDDDSHDDSNYENESEGDESTIPNWDVESLDLDLECVCADSDLSLISPKCVIDASRCVMNVVNKQWKKVQEMGDVQQLRDSFTAYYNLYLWQVKSTFTDVKQIHRQLFLILPPGNQLYLCHELF